MRADREIDGRPRIVVGLLADEGLPSRMAQTIASALPEALTQRLGDEVTWEADHRSESLPLDENGHIPLRDVADRTRDFGWDVAILLTDLPRREGVTPILSDYSVASRVGMLSMPALGPWQIRRRAEALVIHLVGHLVEDRLSAGMEERAPHPFRGLRHITSDRDDVDQHLALDGARGRARLLAGMIIDNRPWRLVPHLAGATAAAAATAAYGVVTTSFWTLANVLAPWRLAIIAVVATLAMTVWLLLYNRLWETPASKQDRGKALLYNLSTLVTLLLGVACMYALLYVLTLLAAFTVIDEGYLSSQIGHRGGLGGYATIAWLATSVGIVAGALGSSFESEEAVRKATYGKRERERQRNAADSSDADTGDRGERAEQH